jgi:predicted RNA-binding Zn-ribbon protein involved in translation (DUF1610 family)
MKYYLICTQCDYFCREEEKNSFCPNCGTKLISACRNCGNKIDNPYEIYCKKCGEKLRDDKENESKNNF